MRGGLTEHNVHTPNKILLSTPMRTMRGPSRAANSD
jgi:hypothetical protein